MTLLKTGILGINARNLLYIRPYNKKKAIQFADNKLKTKLFLEARGIPVPKLYGTIRSKKELDNLKTSRPETVTSGAQQLAEGNAPVQPKTQPVRVEKKVGRNELCPCGSGKKYKQCHGKLE